MPSPTNAPAPPPALVASAEGELPAEIAAAIDLYEAIAANRLTMRSAPAGSAARYGLEDVEAFYAQARAALTATILARLNAAESARDEANFMAESWKATAEAEAEIGNERRAEAIAALARADRLEEALRGDAEWHESEANRLDCLPQNDFVRWQSSVHAEQAAKARAALDQPAPAEET